MGETDWGLKLARADVHIATLSSDISTFLASEPQPFRVSCVFDDSLPGYRVYGQVVRRAPSQWGPVIGEIFHDLRSALANLAHALAGTKAYELTDFPIMLDQERFEGKSGIRGTSGPQMMVGMDKQAKSVIARLQPHRQPHRLPPAVEPLMLIHTLNIEDKHHRLNLVAASSKGVQIGWHSANFPFLAYGTNRWEPFEDGAELEPIRNFFSVPDSNARQEVIASFDLALDPNGSGRGMPLRKCLVDCRNAVEEAILELEPFVT